MADFEISTWDGILDTTYKETRKVITVPQLFNIIKSNEYKIVIERIRNEPDKIKRDALKKTLLSAVTVSGVFDERRASGLKKHSGFICLDFDGVFGRKIEQIKEKLQADKNIYGYFVSASGKGIAVIVKIDPLRHTESFLALEKYFFEEYGLVADTGCKDICRLRFFSYDPNAYINLQSNIFDKFPKADKKPKKHYIDVPATNTDIGRIVSQAIQKSIDITDGSYAEWQRLAASLATLGEAGRDYFHALSQFHPKYDKYQTDRKFSNFLETATGNITIGTFFYFAKRAGLDTNPEKPAKIIKICKEVKKNSTLTIDNAIKRLQEKNVICVDNDETSSNEDIELVKKVFEKVDVSETIGIQEIEDHILNTWKFRRNEISNQLEWISDGSELEDNDFSEIYLETKKQYPKVGKNDVIDIINSKAIIYNPIKEFIEKNRHLITEGKTIGLTGILASCILSDTGLALNDENDEENKSDDTYQDYFMRKWLIGIIASVYGRISPLLLALSGKGNTGKSEFFKRLFPAELRKYNVQMKFGVDKDTSAAMCRYLLILDDELSGKSRMEDKHLKELTSTTIFTFRPPYGRTAISRKRLAVLCGTTNDDAVLSDPTGNRRIIPIKVLEINQDKYNSIDKNALFMEMVRLYESGETWELNNKDIERLEASTIQHIAEDFDRDIILKYFRKPLDKYEEQQATFMTTTDILLALETSGTKQKLSIRKVGLSLRVLKFNRITRRINGIPTYGYLMIKNHVDCITIN
ncbi:MAG: virulence associated protein E [Podoviridae sp. cty5g4]|nr:MAG: virulence associated protein E [Podoviridae sp. cty5g4]